MLLNIDKSWVLLGVATWVMNVLAVLIMVKANFHLKFTSVVLMRQNPTGNFFILQLCDNYKYQI